MKKILSLFLLLCLCFPLFAACNKNPDPTSPSSSTTTTATKEDTPPSFELMNVDFIQSGDVITAPKKELVSIENPNYSVAFSNGKLSQEGFAAELTVSLPNTYTNSGIFFNCAKRDDGSYTGYAFMISRSYVTLQKLTVKPDGTAETLDMGRRAIEPLFSNVEARLRVERKGDSVLLYYLDDYSADIIPWPELELSSVGGSSDSGLGIIDNGGGAGFKALTLYGVDDLYDHGNSDSELQYTNPVFNENNVADPQMIEWQGKFYCYTTSAGGGFSVLQSDDMINWTYMGRCLDKGWNTPAMRFWAPEVFIKDEKFYMIFSNADILGLAVADDPLGPFTHMENPLVYDAIDGHVFFDDDGKVYLYYVSWGESRSYGIYGCELKSDLSAVVPNTEKLLLTPKAQWELQKEAIAEGPSILKHNGTYYLTYSGSHYTDKNYAVGYATSDSPLGEYKRYSASPVLSYTYDVNGPGHHSFITVGGELFIVYHSHTNTTAFEGRQVCIDRVRFAPTKSGIDRLEIYGPTHSPQNAPKTTK